MRTSSINNPNSINMKKYVLSGISGFLLMMCVNAQSLDDTIRIDEAVVTGSRVEINRKNMPVNVSILTQQDINAVEESAVLPVLSRKIPGLFVTERGVTGFGVGSSSAGQVIMRGVGGNPNTQVLMLVDGQPQYMGIFGHPLPNSYVASDLERVEVIKGPAGILYGSNAMGGVVNFITRKQTKEGFTGSARLAYGSYNTQKYMVNGGFRKKGFYAFASVNRDVTDGHRDSSDFEINNAFVKAGYNINKNIEVIADYNIAKFNSVDPGRDFDSSSAFTADIIRGKTSFTVKNKFNSIDGGLYLYYNFGEHNLSDGWFSNDENYGMSVYQGIKLPWNTLFTVGADLKTFGGRGNAAWRSDAANTWYTVNEKSLFAVVRHNLFRSLDISYGLRAENNSLYGNELVPQGGISWEVNPATTLKASVSKGYRNPTIRELYLFAPNPSLEPERMMNYEVNLSQQFLRGKLRSDLSVFLLEGNNVIQAQLNDAPPPMMKSFNVGEFSNKGFELELNYRHNNSLSSSVSYAYLDTNDPILAAPEHQLFAGMNYSRNKLRFSIQGQYIGGLYVDISQNITESYFLLNSSVKYRLLNFMELFVSGKNLLDQKYQINYGYPMPGLHFMTGVNFQF